MVVQRKECEGWRKVHHDFAPHIAEFGSGVDNASFCNCIFHEIYLREPPARNFSIGTEYSYRMRMVFYYSVMVGIP